MRCSTPRTFVPEGDSIHRLAARLRPRLVGGTVRAFDAHDIARSIAETVVGRAVLAVEALGKNLLVYFDDGRALHVHLRMVGRLGVERPRSAYWRPRQAPHQLRLQVGSTVVVGDRIPVLRLLRRGAAQRAPELSRLGPDLLGAEVDIEACVTRLRALGRRPIGEALLEQRAVAGIGNIYKSETLFLEAVAPTALVSELDDATLRALVGRARALLAANLGDGPRITRSALQGSRFWVYGRSGKPCFRCRGPIERIARGAPPGRSTYACSRCQVAPSP
jgi:endonuclease VIII